ncbi:5529_t:CDS:1, partial [Dentiscutata erythropus]
MKLSKRLLESVKSKFCEKYTYEDYIKIYSNINLHKRELEKWIKEKTKDEKEEYFKNIFSQFFYTNLKLKRIETLKFKIKTPNFYMHNHIFIFIGNLEKSYNLITEIYGNTFEMVNAKPKDINNCNSKNIEKLPLLINEFVQKGNDH